MTTFTPSKPTCPLAYAKYSLLHHLAHYTLHLLMFHAPFEFHPNLSHGSEP